MLYTITLSVVIWCLECATVDGGKVLGPIYWNTSNSMFRATTKGHNAIDVDIDDKLDIICPRQGRDDGEEHFYFKLYLVDKTNYLKCNATGGKRLITCNVPKREKKYTFYFQEISPSPWGLEFEPAKTYYVISTSDGSKSGMDTMIGGVCAHFDMKLEMRVHEKKEENIPAGEPDPDVGNEGETGQPIGGKSPQKQPEDSDKGKDITSGSSKINDGDGTDADNGNTKTNTNNHGDTSIKNPIEQGESSNGMWIGIVLGACAVLFILFFAFLGYKIYRKRRNMKKYQSSPISPARPGDPMSQVTLMPISAATRHHSSSGGGPGPHHTRLVSDHDGRHHGAGLGSHVGDMRPPPSYNESFLDNGGSIVAV